MYEKNTTYLIKDFRYDTLHWNLNSNIGDQI